MKSIAISAVCAVLWCTAAAQTGINVNNYIYAYDREYISHYAIDTTLSFYNTAPGEKWIDISTPFEVEKTGKDVTWNFNQEVFTHPITYGHSRFEKDTFFIYAFKRPDDVPRSPLCLNCNEDAEWVFMKRLSRHVYLPPNDTTYECTGYNFYVKEGDDFGTFGGLASVGSVITGYRDLKKHMLDLPYNYGRIITESTDTLASRSLPGVKEFVIQRWFYGVDGYGTLRLPYGNVKGAIKLTSASVEVVRRHYDNGNITTDTQKIWNTYNWYHPWVSGGLPVMEGYYMYLYNQTVHTRPHRMYYTYILKEESIKEKLKTLSLKDVQTKGNSFILYPVPAQDVLHWQRTTGYSAQIRVLNTGGMEILRDRADTPSGTIDIRTLPAGVYVIQITGQDGVETARDVKQ